MQGFETSRFLGDKYSREIRVASMRNAQIISGIINVVSVVLLMPVVQGMDLNHIQLSQIIDAMAPAALILPLTLMIAAVADMAGGGGLLRENSHGLLSARVGYVSVATGAIFLVWPSTCSRSSPSPPGPSRLTTSCRHSSPSSTATGILRGARDRGV